MTKWLCLYKKSNYNDAESLNNNLKKASEGYGLTITDPEWVETKDNDNSESWIKKVEDYKKNRDYSFVVFLLDKNENIYKQLKIHSLCHNGYVSQVVKVKSLKKKCNECLFKNIITNKCKAFWCLIYVTIRKSN